MEFELDKSQKQIQKAVWDFTKGEFDKDLILELEKNNVFPEPIWKKAADLGFIGLHYDEKFSGGGMGMLENVLVAEAFCRRDSTCGAALMMAGFGGEIILRFGSTEQKETYLPPLAEGDTLCGGAFLEPEGGYDLSLVQCRARKEGNEWIINGSKKHVVNGRDAGFFLVLCRSDDQAPSEKAMTMLVVKKEAPGLDITPSPRKLGCTMTSATTLTFDNVRVPESQCIGKTGTGLIQVRQFLDENKIVNAGLALGIAQGALDRTVAYAKQREQFDRKIASFEFLQHKIAEMALHIKTSRLITYEAAWAFDRKKITPSLAAMAMQHACQSAEAVADQGIQIHGGYGYMHEGEIEHFYRDAKYLRTFYSNPGLRNTAIADTVIGKIK